MAERISDIKAEVGLNCLHCGQSQLPPTRDKLHNWTCTYCYSGFVSLAMLTNLLPRELVKKVSEKAPFPRWGRACPKCHRNMEIVMVAEGEARVDFDVCHPCRLLWFDAGRIVKLLKLRDPQELVAHFAQATKRLDTSPPKPEDSVRKVRGLSLVKIFGAAWLAGQFLLLLSGGSAGTGIGFPVVGVAAYLIWQWRAYLRGTVGGLIALVALTNLILVGEFFMRSFRRVAAGGVGGQLSGTLFGELVQFVGSPLSLAYLAAIAIGIGWAEMED